MIINYRDLGNDPVKIDWKILLLILLLTLVILGMAALYGLIIDYI